MALFKKGTKMYSIVKDKCPYCHEGEFFVGKGPYDLRAGNAVHPECSECHGRFVLEPGFFFGAAYVAYALGVAVIVAVLVALRVLWPQAEMMTYIWWVLGTLVVLGPFMYWKSRIIWANMFMKYGQPKLSRKKSKTVETSTE